MKKVTIRDVAKEAGVSAATISRALSGKSRVAPETKLLIEKAVKQTGYILSDEAELALGLSKGIVYFVMKSFEKNSYARLLNGSMIKNAELHSVRIISVNLDYEGTGAGFPDEDILLLAKEAKQTNAKGIIISGFSDQKMLPSTRDVLRSYHMPLVFINRSLTPYSFNRILTGSDRGAYLATQHLIENGRRNLLMLQLPNHGGKTKGYLEAVRDLPAESLQHQVVVVPDDNKIESVAELVENVLNENPGIDGILCCEDEIAAGVLRTALKMGKKVPQEIEIIGYNDNIAPLLTPPLSSVSIPLDKICESAIEMLLDSSLHLPDSTAKTILLDPQLIIR